MAFSIYKKIIKPILFKLDPEMAHKLTFLCLKVLYSIPGFGYLAKHYFMINHPSLQRNFLGLTFKNPVGLAAGFDKDGKYIKQLESLGFGFVEIGTVTPLAQSGNDTPRLFRLPADEALINRMGFNNEGVQAMIQRLRTLKTDLIIGGNLGKNKITPLEEAYQDYAICFRALFPYVDYFVVNVSSPNTPNLRALQEKEPLTHLLQKLQSLNQELALRSKPKPILLKIAPDLTMSQIDDIIDIVQSTGIQGIVATNTTILRHKLSSSSELLEQIGAGGLSGKPLKHRSTEIIRYISSKTHGKMPIIAAGGIHSANDALEKIQAGATLVQVYTGYVYEGPGLVKKINKRLLELA